ncbi:MAG: phenylalanine--tRNA ligase subunit beta [Ruminococcaceae bacterium]|nr:phenylalanine--tRNA ligase subunit beta [Oscillospiraceae bacterium]
MNLSMKWLADFTDVSDVDIKEYCDRMTDTGSKVEGYTALGDDIENVVVGKILKIEKHPDSDHLQICQISTGDAERQIVTGAQNIFEGAIIPVAVPVAKLPGGVVIKPGKLRGVESDGMLCSIGELALTTHDMPGADENGIFIMNSIVSESDIGKDAKEVLMLSDKSVEFEITSNRPDCLSVIGLARETAVSFGRELNIPTPTVKEGSGDISEYISVDVEDAELCPRYSARVIKNVKIEPSPLWLRMRLRASGVRPINNIVDITNYVMLEYGQPMHAFDYAMLEGKKIVVRRAAEGESFKSLDDTDHILNANTLVIADEKKAVALAGVMGGANSEIKDSTTTVVFESANFLGSSVRLAAKAQGMRTESSGRFEKGLDPENTMAALNRACELVNLLGAGEVVGGCIDVYKNKKAANTVKFDAAQINAFLGTDICEEKMLEILSSLGCTVENGVLTAPSYRADIENMNDIAEEIARIYGYNNIPSTPFKCEVKAGMLTPKQAYKARLHNVLCSLGISQSVTFSFVSPKTLDTINLPEDAPERRQVVITNPLGEDTSVMRTTLIPSVLGVLARNNNYHSDSVALYELGHIYIPNEDVNELPAEPLRLTFAFYGKGDFYTLKGMVEAILSDAGIARYRFASEPNNPVFHPGRCANIIARGFETVGTIGQIHPKVAANYGFDGPVYLADIDFEKLFSFSNFDKHYKALPKYPPVNRDFAFVCDKDTESGAIEDVIRKAAGKLVEDVKLFDTYVGERLGEGKKSLAFRVTLRAADHTLTEEESEKTSAKIVASVEKQLGITLRG